MRDVMEGVMFVVLSLFVLALTFGVAAMGWTLIRLERKK